ncbi:MAG: alanine racemase [Candidatus Nanopelagicales bacterium]
MTFTLHVDGDRWRTHAAGVRDDVRRAISAGTHQHSDGDLVPVAKGNGYGLGIERLAREAAALGLTRLAVGTVFEAAEVVGRFDGDVLVLTPFEPSDRVAAPVWDALASGPSGDRVVRTVSSREAWDSLVVGPARVVLEGLTSMGRFGLAPDELALLLADPATAAALADDRVRLHGLALHLPLVQPSPDHRAVPGARWKDAAVAPAPPAGASARVAEALSWGLGWQQQLGDLSDRLSRAGAERAVTALTDAVALWVSHLDDVELASLRGALPDIALYARIGTRLWLGDRGALQARGTVLAVHLVQRGQASGYRQRRAARASAVVVVGGGTAHGVALEAPSAAGSVRARAVAAGTGVLEAGGRALSPFHLAGRQRWFAEPPHMQVSLVRVPEGTPLPAVGSELDCDVRMTTASFDAVRGLD